MERYALSKRGPLAPPMRVSSLASSETHTLSSAGRSSDASSLRSARSGLSFDSGHRTSQESTKPRLSKDQQEFLERHFAQHQKPNTQTKKVFANDLNVPLEKINNWFQNRRAKSKQDAKKKHNAFQHFAPPHPYATGRHPADGCFIDPSFYHHTQPNPAYMASWQPVLPGNSVEPYVNTNTAQFGVPLEASELPQAPPGAEQMMMHDDTNDRGFNLFFGFDDFNDPNAINMYSRQFPGPEPGNGMMDTIPEYEVPEPPVHSHHSSHMNGDMRRNRSSADEAAYGMNYPPGSGDLPMAPSADFFHQDEAQNDRYAMRTWGHSAGRPLDGDHPHLPMGLHMTMAPGDSQLPYRTVDDAHQSAGVRPSSLHHRPLRGSASMSSMDQFGMRSPENLESAILNDDQLSSAASPDSAKEPGLRRESTISELVESIDGAELQSRPRTLERKSSHQSIGHPSLASRRQRRPAPLSAANARSTSFTSNNSASPSKTLQSQSSQRELRRVRSSIGVSNGRVQKAGLAISSQKAPLNFPFNDAASSRIAKSLSSRSMTSMSVDTLSRTNSLVPITPVSPPDEEQETNKGLNGDKTHTDIHEIDFSNEESIWASMPDNSDTLTESIWSSHISPDGAMDQFENYASPPETPLQPGQVVGSSPHQQSGLYSMSAAPAPFVPQWQQSIHGPMASHNYSAPLPPAMMSFHPHLLRRQGEQASLNKHTSSDVNGQMSTHSDDSESSDLLNMDQFQAAQQKSMLQRQQSQRDHQEQQGRQTISPAHQMSRSQSQPQPTPSSLSSPPQSLHQSKQSQVSSGQHVFHVDESDLPSADSSQISPHGKQARAPSTPRPSQSQELMIQQFSPRTPVDPSRLPPKGNAKVNEVPRSFEFQTLGPKNFFSSP